MAETDGATASVEPLSTPSTDATSVSATAKPPPETQESIWLRRSVIVSFWLVVVLLGLPVWWKTTAIYRAELPLETMGAWAESKVCQPAFPLKVAVEAPIPAQDAQHLLRDTQHSLDELNDFSAHRLSLLLADAPFVANASQQIVTDGIAVDVSHDEDIALSVRLVPVETGHTPRSLLQPYSPRLDVYYGPSQLPTAASTGSPLATYIAEELHKLFGEEQALLAHLLSKTPGPRAPVAKRLSSGIIAELEHRSTRALKYAPTYHLTFSLFTPINIPSDWDIESALQRYMSPFLDSLTGIHNFTIDTQVQLYSGYTPTVRPEFDEQSKSWTLRKEDLSGFINAAEWPLTPSIGAGPTVNFVLYVPDRSQSPLVVKETGGNSWLVPQWGGVVILNPTEADEAAPAIMTREALAPAMHTFSTQLMSLLGLPQSPGCLPLRISTLVRVRAASLLFSASSTLGALARLYNALPSIPIPDKVAKSVDLTTEHLQLACDSLKEGRFHSALEHARVAEAEAEKAFFERSMVGQVYFPDEHKVAVYLPLLGPVAVPLIMAALKELQTTIRNFKARRSS
ncbi:hypothetical protein M011DRAFT_491593 [Sporormia fimetaria CBS 119925]|uniref:GPI transamidase component PIG-S n=1 Tax=Sporormia fimetaria CBS 119925 TaxID=1340428 RepID=A0A6A6VRJ9_9PLEO|nr:hypothetical protein M011DRAFT_491593 [Sporormia fimetaria CBS 119925]